MHISQCPNITCDGGFLPILTHRSQSGLPSFSISLAVLNSLKLV